MCRVVSQGLFKTKHIHTHWIQLCTGLYLMALALTKNDYSNRLKRWFNTKTTATIYANIWHYLYSIPPNIIQFPNQPKHIYNLKQWLTTFCWPDLQCSWPLQFLKTDFTHSSYFYPHSLQLYKENTIDTNTWFHESILILNQKSLNFS